MRIDYSDGFAERLWNPLDGRVYADPRWLRASARRPGRHPFTLRVADDEGAVSALGYVHPDASAGEAYNLRRLVVGEPAVFAWSDAGVGLLAHAAGRRAPAMVPNVTVTLPGYDLGLTRTPSARTEHLKTMAAALLDIAEERADGTCAVLYVGRDDAELAGVLGGAGFCPVALTSRALLPVAWDSLDAYVAHFPASRRHRLRGELRRIRTLAMTSTLDDPAGSVDTMVRLRCAHLGKFGRPADEAAERERITALVHGFAGDQLSLILTGIAGRVTSCSLHLRTGTTITVLLAATDPAAAVPFSHYENTFYAPIRLGLTRPGDVVDYGVSHLEHKTIRGCVGRPLDAWVRCGEPAAMDTVRRIGRLSMAYSVEAPAPPAGHVDALARAGVDIVTGVPDSSLAAFFDELHASAMLAEAGPLRFVPATREDSAVALAAGAALAGAMPLVAMKSMGLGTALDAVTSLAKVYELPMVLYVSWAGYAGRDVPHHNVLGAALVPVLDGLGLPHLRHVIARVADFATAVHRAVEAARTRGGPVVLLGIPAELADGAGHAA